MIFLASSHWVEQYLLPCSAIQVQPSRAHLCGDDEVIAGSSWTLSPWDARKYSKDVAQQKDLAK